MLSIELSCDTWLIKCDEGTFSIELSGLSTEGTKSDHSLFELTARGLIAPSSNSVKQFEKEYIFLIVTNSLMGFLTLVTLILTCVKRRDPCSGFALLLIFSAFLIQCIYYGLQYKVHMTYTPNSDVRVFMYPSAVSAGLIACLYWLYSGLILRASYTIPASQNQEEPLEKEKKIKCTMLKFGIVKVIPIIAIVILSIVTPFVDDDQLTNYLSGFYATSIAFSIFGLIIAMWGIKRAKDFHGDLMSKKCLFIVHIVAFISNIAFNIAALSMLAS